MEAVSVAGLSRVSAGPVREVGVPQLVFERQGHTLFIHPLRGRMVVGRSDQCDVALPGDQISRRHAVFHQREQGWQVVDRSRHGTRVNGERVERRNLRSGDVVQIGGYDVRFEPDRSAGMRVATASMMFPSARAEEVVGVETSQVTTTRACARFTRGSLKGQSHALRQARVTLGGSGSEILLHDLPVAAVILHVVRGRVILAPGELQPKLAGQVVREPTPVYPGEEVTIRGHCFVLQTETRARSGERQSFGRMVGSSVAMTRLFGVLARLATNDFPVLLVGESGTGKELAAQALHAESDRTRGPFVPINCAALAPNLVESELFGHVRGAFTGAAKDHPGAFVRAAGGVLFLDEVGELPLELQAKLLRALESGEVRPVGGNTASFPDVRIIAATNRDLEAMCAEGTFREDLYFRLSVLPVRLPSLRERTEDVVPLAHTLLARQHPGATLSPSAEEALIGYHWPGNARELRNVLTRAVVLHGPEISASAIEFRPEPFSVQRSGGPLLRSGGERERVMLLACLERNDFNRSRAARELGIPRSTLLYKMKRWEIT